MTESLSSAVLGIDIGGANIKYALIDAKAFPKDGSTISDQTLSAPSVNFPMWKLHRKLSEQLVSDLSQYSSANVIGCGITMTGELADCFFDRKEGVTEIVQQAFLACKQLQFPDPLYYGVNGKFHLHQECDGQENLLAASNWHGLAQYVGSTGFSNGLLIDIGSTTTDLIPIRQGRVATSAKTDFDRLCEGSLVYLGGERTSVSMIVDSLLHLGYRCPVMREHFATMKDVRVILGMRQGEEEDCDTADGKPSTIPYAMNRLARIIGCSGREITSEDAMHLARQIHEAAKKQILDGLKKVETHFGVLGQYLVSGHNDDLVPISQPATHKYLSEIIGTQGARNAPAVAIAGLLLQVLKTKGVDLDTGEDVTRGGV